jgi:hypothetical protein
MMKSLAIRSARLIDGTGRMIERATVVIKAPRLPPSDRIETSPLTWNDKD